MTTVPQVKPGEATVAAEPDGGSRRTEGELDAPQVSLVMPCLVELLRQGNDLAIGSRLRGRIDDGAMPWLHRYVCNPRLTGFRRLHGARIRTSGAAGFRAFTRGSYEPWGVVFLLGLGGNLFFLLERIGSNFGRLEEVRKAFLGMMLTVLGVQTVSNAFLLRFFQAFFPTDGS